MAGFGAVKNALRLKKAKLVEMRIPVAGEGGKITVNHHFDDSSVRKYPFEAQSGGELAEHLMKHIAADEGTGEGVDGAGDDDDGGEGRPSRERTPGRAAGKVIDEPRNPLRLDQGAYRSQGRS